MRERIARGRVLVRVRVLGPRGSGWRLGYGGRGLRLGRSVGRHLGSKLLGWVRLRLLLARRLLGVVLRRLGL